MPCDSCGHSKGDHKQLPMALYYCNVCNKVESSVSFPGEAAGDGSSPSTSQAATQPEDLLKHVWDNKRRAANASFA